MGDKRRRFDPEFRERAVRIVKETGKPVAQVARDLEINPYTLHNAMKATASARPRARRWASPSVRSRLGCAGRRPSGPGNAWSLRWSVKYSSDQWPGG
ncbi:transposase [Actinomadura bangladeshensis]|uniref:transposase n=1 Tax=Actinomadura bangladeshensis TaxID=453573 RepID=UPI001942387F